MTQFTERHHAFIAAQFYKYLKERHGDRGLQVFVMATRRYGEQRGCRMAQRALRDGKELSFTTYREYGEWANTQPVIEEGIANKSEIVSTYPDYVMRISCCPWATQFDEMGLSECGVLYCRHVDESLARGFNPDLKYEVLCSINDHDCCLHIMRGARLLPPPGPKDPANLRDFGYHCGHIFKTFCETACTVLGDTELSDLVLRAFAEAYGDELAQELAGRLDEDYNLIDEVRGGAK